MNNENPWTRMANRHFVWNGISNLFIHKYICCFEDCSTKHTIFGVTIFSYCYWRSINYHNWHGIRCGTRGIVLSLFGSSRLLSHSIITCICVVSYQKGWREVQTPIDFVFYRKISIATSHIHIKTHTKHIRKIYIVSIIF